MFKFQSFRALFEVSDLTEEKCWLGADIRGWGIICVLKWIKKWITHAQMDHIRNIPELLIGEALKCCFLGLSPNL